MSASRRLLLEQVVDAIADSEPRCTVPWQVLAAMAAVERATSHALDPPGRSHDGPGGVEVGPRLDGSDGVLFLDSDHGVIDGDRRYDRGVGPLHLLPTTWASYGADGNGDDQVDHGSFADSARTAVGYLCATGVDLRTRAGLRTALRTYHGSAQGYVHLVTTVAIAVSGVTGKAEASAG